jgi:hypothetical protein
MSQLNDFKRIVRKCQGRKLYQGKKWFDTEKVKLLTPEEKDIVVKVLLRFRMPIVKEFVDSEENKTLLQRYGYFEQVTSKNGLITLFCSAENKPEGFNNV